MKEDQLNHDIESAIKTTMIGAISEIENTFGHMWGHKKRDTTEEQDELYEDFMELRERILNIGNFQIRKIKRIISDDRRKI